MFYYLKSLTLAPVLDSASLCSVVPWTPAKKDQADQKFRSLADFDLNQIL